MDFCSKYFPCTFITIIPYCVSLTTSIATYTQQLLTYDAIGGLFMTIKLRPRQPSCEGCSKHSQLLPTTDYVQWCGGVGPDDKVSVTCN